MFANNSNLFGTQQANEQKEEHENSDGGAQEDKDEAPIYATEEAGSSAIKQEVKKSPYVKEFEKKCSLFKITAPKSDIKEIDNG